MAELLPIDCFVGKFLIAYLKSIARTDSTQVFFNPIQLEGTILVATARNLANKRVARMAELQRWTSKRKAEVVLEITRGNVTAVDFCL